MNLKKTVIGTSLIGLLMLGTLTAQEKEPMEVTSFILDQQCIGPNGDTTNQGVATTQFKAADEGCEQASRTCLYGVFDGDDSYHHAACPTLTQTENDCQRNDQTVPEFSTIIAYKEKSVPRDMTCSFVQKICIAGELVGPANFTETSCQFQNRYSEAYQESNSDAYDKFGNIKPESLLLPPLGKGDSCTTSWGEIVPSGQTVISFTKQNAGLQGVREYKINICIDGSLDDETREYPSSVYKNPDDIAADDCSEQLTTCTEYKNGIASIINEYEAKLKICNPEFVPYDYTTTSDGFGGLEEEPCERNGKTIADGQSITAYQKGQWKGGQFICPEETRSCNNGKLSGSYEETLCNHPGNGPHRCATPNGPIDHGRSVTLFKDATVAYPNECESIERACEFGDLQGDEDYETSSCKQTGELCDMPRGGTIGHGTSIIAFSETSVPYKTDCGDFSLTRECINGKLSGSDNYQYNSCVNEQPQGCSIDGGLIGHGQTITRYKFPSVITPVQSEGNDLCIHQSRTCDNGVWSNLEGTPSGFTYSFKSCTVVAPGENISN